MSNFGDPILRETDRRIEHRNRTGHVAGIRNELEQARQRVAFLELHFEEIERAEKRRTMGRIAPPESPTLVLVCQILIYAIIGLPIVALLIKLAQRMLT